jgi:competence protein ComK
MKERQIEEYLINPFTMYIEPEMYGCKVYSKIYELEGNYVSPFKPFDIIKKSCEYFASSYAGRKEGTKQLTGVTHKVPIAIDPTNFIYFFPTTSPARSECIWISHQHVIDFQRNTPRQTLAIFQNKQTAIIPISRSSFESQMQRTSSLRLKLMERIGQTETKAFYLMNRSNLIEASETMREYKSGSFFEPLDK